MTAYVVDEVRSTLPLKIVGGASSFLISSSPRGIATGHANDVAFYNSMGVYKFGDLVADDTVEILSTGEIKTWDGSAFVVPSNPAAGGRPTVRPAIGGLPIYCLAAGPPGPGGGC